MVKQHDKRDFLEVLHKVSRLHPLHKIDVSQHGAFQFEKKSIYSHNEAFVINKVNIFCKELEMNYEWKKINGKGSIEIGLFLVFHTKPVDGYPETMIVLHCFGNSNKVVWLSSRFYFKANESKVTDGFFHWVSDDVKSILEETCQFELAENLIMHAEYYANVEKFPESLPFSLGDYSFM